MPEKDNKKQGSIKNCETIIDKLKTTIACKAENTENLKTKSKNIDPAKRVAELSAKEQESRRKFKEKVNKIKKDPMPPPPSIKVTSDGVTEADISAKEQELKYKFKQIINKIKKEPTLQSLAGTTDKYQKIIDNKNVDLKSSITKSNINQSNACNKVISITPDNVIKNNSILEQFKKITGDIFKNRQFGNNIKWIKKYKISLFQRDKTHPQNIIKYPNVFESPKSKYNLKNLLIWKNYFVVAITCVPTFYAMYHLCNLPQTVKKVPEFTRKKLFKTSNE